MGVAGLQASSYLVIRLRGYQVVRLLGFLSYYTTRLLGDQAISYLAPLENLSSCLSRVEVCRHRRSLATEIE